jgi:hypothetical protein
VVAAIAKSKHQHTAFRAPRGTVAGAIVDMKELGVWEPYEVKAQTLKTAVESAMLLLRIDDIVSGIQKKDKMAPGQSKPGPQAEDPDQARHPALQTWRRLLHAPAANDMLINSIVSLKSA